MMQRNRVFGGFVAISLALGVGACPGEEESSESGADTVTASTDDSCADDLPQLRIINTTGNAFDEIQMLACDMSSQASYPIPPGGLPTGGELTINLPGPGCWQVTYTGEGCFTDVPFMTEIEACQTATWEAGQDNHGCAGG